jgi:hypothetical protein
MADGFAKCPPTCSEIDLTTIEAVAVAVAESWDGFLPDSTAGRLAAQVLVDEFVVVVQNLVAAAVAEVEADRSTVVSANSSSKTVDSAALVAERLAVESETVVADPETGSGQVACCPAEANQHDYPPYSAEAAAAG